MRRFSTYTDTSDKDNDKNTTHVCKAVYLAEDNPNIMNK